MKYRIYSNIALFAMSAALFLSTLSNMSNSAKISKLEKAVNPKKENVIGEDPNEVFYEINGKKAYLEIDGKPIEGYFNK